MTGITIIIVNYNVKYFLRQCLQSILNSDYSGAVEIIVVDNNSQDGSDVMMAEEFPSIQYIYNTDNKGFSKANNQAIKIAAQPYTLILNPDTILQEDTLSICAQYLDKHSEVGAVGVKMVDGSGTYLPESKRGFPTPLNSIYKLSGLSRLFPRSKVFNYYYQGHLSDSEVNPIEVLTGAFTFAKTDLLQKIGGFDEDYFMYGEDIELSYQIKKTGQAIHYLPTTQIIHFKGESTRKLSRKYLTNFYGAMGIYAGKRNKGSALWAAILRFGIIASAIVGLTRKFARAILRPLLDWVLLFGATKAVEHLWAIGYHQDPNYYKSGEFNFIFLVLTFVAIICYGFLGQYDRRHNLKHLFYGFIFSSLSMLSLYSLMPSEWRSSRLILMSLALLSSVILYVSRRLYNRMLFGTTQFDTQSAKRVAIVGNSDSVKKIDKIITQFSGAEAYIGSVGVDGQGMIGTLADLPDIVESRSLNEIVFCSKDMSTQQIFTAMADLGNKVSFKLANNDNTSILGSDSKERVGEWYTLDLFYKITQPFHIRTKRLVDIGAAVLCLIGFPLVLLSSPSREKIFTNLFPVLIGKKSWIGYRESDVQGSALPELRDGVFELMPLNQGTSAHKTNLHYAKNYSTWSELSMLATFLFKKPRV